ncbi:MAG: CDP-alcohol phosphatidyltransferase family protein [Phaeodactylibacter sp.]|nr:CDP-alcohol phosphatidyltransferase family protein [Phaeodactylibacter sp.]MCB9052064.1 CDP-alcohol phosphatidyltransferase family protein [Lewinellaceae bacterium]
MPTTFTTRQKALAWSVHLFTATGVLTVFMAILAVSAHQFQEAMLWLLAALLIDGIDGTLARRFRVTEVLPNVSGKNIDYVIDFASYAIVPAYMIYESGLMEGPWNLAAVFIILLVSAVYYGKEGMVSDDHYFVGFPVMWNMAAFYMIFVFQWGHWANILLIVVLSILHFVPIKVAYPSRTAHWRWPTLAATITFFFALVSITLLYPEKRVWLSTLAWLCLVYFAVFTVWATLQSTSSNTMSG